MHFHFLKIVSFFMFAIILQGLLATSLPALNSSQPSSHLFNNEGSHPLISAEKRGPVIDYKLATSNFFQIKFKDFPKAFNPSLIKHEKGFLLTFRYCPHKNKPWISEIYLAMLDEAFQPISKPQLLDTRSMFPNSNSSQSEDARIFKYNEGIYIIYNDNLTGLKPSLKERRDMFVAEILNSENNFFLSTPVKLIHKQKYPQQLWQKNWVPFEWNHHLLLGYTITPHEILNADLISGECIPFSNTAGMTSWSWGTLRGGTPAILLDNEYIAFFHSAKKITSSVSHKDKSMWHYYMGVYTFSSEPPFNITKISPNPIFVEGFYSSNVKEKRVVFPGGIAVTENKIYVAYGKDDEEIWIAEFDKEYLKKTLVPINTIFNPATE